MAWPGAKTWKDENVKNGHSKLFSFSGLDKY
jgi:hypothetical protein